MRNEVTQEDKAAEVLNDFSLKNTLYIQGESQPSGLLSGETPDLGRGPELCGADGDTHIIILIC